MARVVPRPVNDKYVIGGDATSLADVRELDEFEGLFDPDALSRALGRS